MLAYESISSLSSFSFTPFLSTTLVVTSNTTFILSPSLHPAKFRLSSAKSKHPDQEPDSNANNKLNSNPKSLNPKIDRSKLLSTEDGNSKDTFLKPSQRKPRRGRKSEAAAVEDYVRDSLDKAITSIRARNPDVMDGKPDILKEQHNDNDVEKNDPGNDGDDKSMVVEEDDSSWPVDADVGLGFSASEYFEKHSIKNVVGEDGTEIDWEGEIEEGLVNEITCLEWERFSFHPSPLIVLVFERYNRASENWKVLIELEKAAAVFWRAKDRLPPRTIKIDINIERDLAYALKAKECPQILFLKGSRILYREKEYRNSEELVQMIAHFYYNAKKPPCLKKEAKPAPQSPSTDPHV